MLLRLFTRNQDIVKVDKSKVPPNAGEDDNDGVPKSFNFIAKPKRHSSKLVECIV